MTQAQWSEVDRYFVERLAPEDEDLTATLEANATAKLPAIDVAPNQGKFLQILAQIQGAQSILEIGTLGGYSTIWLARALPPGGRLVTLEVSAKHAKLAEANIARAGLSGLVDIRQGSALDTLPKLEAEGCGPFDFFFIDADKTNNSSYLAWALKLSRKGSTIVLDNVVRGGAVTDLESTDRSVVGTQKAIDWLANEPRVSATAIQTVGSKGYDGFAIAIVTADP
ncbi:MAG: O-methyltransferase [Cyanobacteria bacterium P01_D01_bin.123]